ncbi:MAG: MFS transporter [Candidatus Hodarchaeota archaeon]
MAEINQELDKKKSIWSWVFYDWANSAFATTVIAGFIPSIMKVWAKEPGFTQERADALSLVVLGYGSSIASLIVAIMAFFLGAIADRMAGKKKFLMLFASLGILMTACLSLVSQGQWRIGILLYIFGSIGFSGGNIFYDSLLPGVASKKKADFVSSLGFAIGYIGGGLLFVINVIMVLMAGEDDNLKMIATSYSFLTVAIWWAVFSIPIFLFVKEPRIYEKTTVRKAISLGVKQLKNTFQDLKNLKVVALFLFAYWFYIDGVDTIIRMAVSYGSSALHFGLTDLILALLITQFVAFPMTILYNKFAKKIGVKRGVLVAIIAYCGITVAGYMMSHPIHFYILAIAVGCFQGGIQALSRSLYNRIIPPEKSAQFFGFFNMLGKFAAILGPAIMATASLFLSEKASILFILVLFVAGGILLYKVDIDEGERMAKEFLSKPIDQEE